MFVKNKKYERGGRLKVKVHILFYGDNSWTVAVGQMKFGIVEDHGDIPTSCILSIILFK
jgi:hypothetical protein